jgi:alpha-L-fucosidase
MKGMGRWLKVNSEAIHATRPWKVYAEGPADMRDTKKSKSGKELSTWNYRLPFTAQDIRFTQSKDGKTVYAITLNWPEDGKVLIKSLKAGSVHYPQDIQSVSMVGSDEDIKWTRTAEGLEVSFPKEKPCEWAFALKIQ